MAKHWSMTGAEVNNTGFPWFYAHPLLITDTTPGLDVAEHAIVFQGGVGTVIMGVIKKVITADLQITIRKYTQSTSTMITVGTLTIPSSTTLDHVLTTDISLVNFAVNDVLIADIISGGGDMDLAGVASIYTIWSNAQWGTQNGLVFKGDYASGTYTQGNVVTYSGSLYVATRTTTGNPTTDPTGWQPIGAPGPPGTAATIAVGTTTTLSPGSSATVTNSGTSSAAIFNFGIPKGDAGPGVPVGGVAGEYLKKNSSTDYDTVWGFFVDAETPSGTINGSNTSFTLAHTPSPTTSLKLYQNGVRLIPTTNYTLSGSTITMIVAPKTNDWLLADYRY